MGLTNLLYRCPRCGLDPLEGRGDEAHCAGCGSHFARGREGAGLRVTGPDGDETAPASALARSIAELGGPLPTSRSGESAVGDLLFEADVTRSRSVAEEPVYYRGRLLGYAERQGEGKAGTLRLTDEEVLFLDDGSVLDRWHLLEIRALQSSSSLVQLSLEHGELVQFRFHGDSPRRWEELLRIALQRAWKDAGRGKIVEFQPRIVSR